jgi:hypothetical protein
MALFDHSVSGILCFGATVISTRPTNGASSYQVSKWPIGIILYRGNESPMRTSPVARLGIVQVEKGERDMRVAVTERGPTSHATLFRTPPPSLKVEWQGGVRNPLGNR